MKCNYKNRPLMFMTAQGPDRDVPVYNKPFRPTGPSQNTVIMNRIYEFLYNNNENIILYGYQQDRTEIEFAARLYAGMIKIVRDEIKTDAPSQKSYVKYMVNDYYYPNFGRKLVRSAIAIREHQWWNKPNEVIDAVFDRLTN